MVITSSYFSNDYYATHFGQGFDGVVKISHDTLQGSGSLLFDGRTILTTAHLFEKGIQGPISIQFHTANGIETLSTNNVLIHPHYDAANSNNDLALIRLDQAAPPLADRYQLYRTNDEIGQAFNLIGYGYTGTGDEGANKDNDSLRLQAWNQFDADISELKGTLGNLIGWQPEPGTQLIADFDNGLEANDALGYLIGKNDLGLGVYEGFIASGDSGGPAFLANQIAGVATYTTRLSRDGYNPDLDHKNNSSFGEIAAWQRISHYQQWIDESVRTLYPHAPTRAQEVQTHVIEGDEGTTLTYFFLEFHGTRSDPHTILSVDYATRDGTATAGSDYIAAEGRLNLYPGENYALIPVEIIGDTLPEPDEYFYLDVFNPVGGDFGPGVSVLSAMRTIIDDDGWQA